MQRWLKRANYTHEVKVKVLGPVLCLFNSLTL